MTAYYKAGYSDKVIIFDNKNYWLDIGELFSYKWSYNTFNNRIAEFSKNISERKFTVTVTGNNNMSLAKANNEMIQIFDSDVRMKQPGRIYIDDYYLEGYVVNSNKTQYENNIKDCYSDGISENEFMLVTEQKFWRKDILFEYGRENIVEGLTYPKGYPYGYVNSARKISNSDIVPCDFKMTVYGPCENPAVSVGIQTYQLNLILEEGECVQIFSDRKAVIKTKITGEKESVFSYRNRNFDIFAKIPAGKTMVGWTEGLVFDIMLISERGEPEWTRI